MTSRDRNDPYPGSSSYLKDAIKEYGRANFTKVIFGSYATREKAHAIEAYLCKRLDTVWPNGYNNSPDGGTGPGFGHHSEETRKKISASIKIAKNRPGATDYLKTPEYRAKMSASQKIAQNRQEVREKISRPVVQYALDGTLLQTYIGAREAMFQTGANEVSIGYCCKGSRLVAGGFQWRYYEGNTDDIEPIQQSNNPMRNPEVVARSIATHRANFRHALMVRMGQIPA